MDDILSHRLHFPRIRVSADSGTWTESNLHYVFTYLNMRKTWKCHKTMERVLNFQESSRSQESLFVFHLSASWKRVGSRTFLSIYNKLNKFDSGSLFITIGNSTVVKPNLVPPKGIWFPANSGLVLTQLTTWDDWRAVQKFLWGWHWSIFKNIGC